MARFNKTSLNGVVEIIRDSLYEDYRGTYDKTFALPEYGSILAGTVFPEDGISTSHRNVLRGIHGNSTTTKIVSCIYGCVYDVIVDNDPESDQYLQWQAFVLTPINGRQLFIPPKFGNSYLVTSELAIYSYKLSDCYDNTPEQFTLKWNDPKINIFWPCQTPILSARDAKATLL